MTFTVASLFAGIGGIDKGFEQAGAKVVWANEFDKYACQTYRLNFNHTLIEDDVRNLQEYEMPNVDIITAGWPCVAFSVAGNRHGMTYMCKECGHEHSVTYNEYINGAQCPECNGSTEAKDPRGTLFFDVIRFIRAKKPKAVFLENVKNLRGHDKGNTFRVIQEMLRDSGYFIDSKIMNTMEYGNIPQNRERIFIVGFRDEQQLQSFEWPGKLNLTKTIDNILDRNDKQDERYYYSEESQYYPMIKESMKRFDTVYQLRRVYMRENQSNVCPTLTANMGTGGHNVPLIIDEWGFRKLTPKEALKFQGFPVDKGYKIPEEMAKSHIYKQAGNAVSVPVVQRIAANLLKVLEEGKAKDKKETAEYEQLSAMF
ncbi:DNA (cytosine-5-)-methyltransferase [Gracilibacillus alcaliphilus]|uniref:DNA (cytosine-5-)-methyltransferase n=1 Tax=Gracilibacillus alcaliphilus TaxID=1401441 RepID=UPI001958A9C6|nr:DNA (cytosine-5-)-methyltransferase [Gracilibacillus alcaliphilus]MBM7679594.1 DNA (cytosine-5)-methyltransferase 1 [Gracilibacillus alcaliphilus]